MAIALPRPAAAPAPALLTEAAIDTAAMVTSLRQEAAGRAGAIVTFTGVARADVHDGRPVLRVRVDAYPEMAREELQRIHDEAVARFRLTGLRIAHRTDMVEVGEELVAVAAASAHRDAAFAAAAWVMDEIKRRVPLWKLEARADGSGRWVTAEHCRCGMHD